MPGFADERVEDGELTGMVETLRRRVADLQRRVGESPLQGEALMGQAVELLSASLTVVETVAERAQCRASDGPSRPEYRLDDRGDRGVSIGDAVDGVPEDSGQRVGDRGTLLDRSARRQVQKALQRSEEHFQTLIENALDIIATFDADGIVRYISPSIERMLGYRSEELIDRNIREFVHPDDLPGVAQMFDQAIHGRDHAAPIEARLRHRDGSWRILEGVGRSLLDDAGCVRVIANGRDVTEHKQAEQSLRETELTLRAIVEHATDAIYIKDRQGHYMLINPAGAVALNRTVEEVLGKRDVDLLGPEVGGEIEDIDRRVIATGRPHTDERPRIVSGVERVFLTTKFPYLSDSGEVLGIIGISHEITERKRRERELEAIVAMSAALRSVPTLAGMLPVILDQLLSLLNAEGAAMIISGPAGDGTTAELARGMWADWGNARSVLGEGIVGRVMGSGQPFVSHNVQADPLVAHAGLPASLRAVVCVPLIAHEQTIGALAVGRRTKFSPAEHRVLAAIADLAANAVRRASLFEQTTQLYGQLQSRERFITRIVESMPSSLVVIDRTLRIVSANRNFLEKARRVAPATLGRKVDEVFPRVLMDYTRLDQKVREVFRTGQMVDGGKLAYRAPGLPTRVYYYRLIPLKPDGTVENVMLLMDDITEREQLGEEVRRAERHLASVVECANDLVVSMDPQGCIVTWNRAAERTSGLKVDQVKGRSLLSLSAARQWPAMAEMLQTLARGAGVQNTEVNLLTASGQEVPISWSCSAMRDDPGQVAGIVAVGRDLTERRRLEDQLIHSAKMASLGVMAGGIAHELRNPLGIISASAQLLLEHSDNDQLRNQCTQKISTATHRASLIIENLLKYAHPLSGEMRAIDLAAVLEETLVLLAHEVSLRQIVLHKICQENLLWVRGNPGLLQQVFTNLILNACNAMPGGGTLNVIARTSKANQVEILFRDSGRGIAPDHLPKIFDPFFTTMPVGKGTGLGLSISYSIVQQHQGTIEVESRIDEGTTFTVRLPAISEGTS